MDVDSEFARKKQKYHIYTGLKEEQSIMLHRLKTILHIFFFKEKKIIMFQMFESKVCIT